MNDCQFPKSSTTPYYGWALFFCGICMGAADLVPGISGGTIAFILGFYHPLIASLKTINKTAINHLFQGRWKEFSSQVAWKFICTLLAGVLTAFICLSNLFHYILGHEVYRVYLYATFLGLILASFFLCVRQVKAWNKHLIIGLFFGGLAAFALTETAIFNKPEGEFAVEIPLKESVVSVANYQEGNHLLTGLSIQALNLLITQGVLQDTTPVYNNQHSFIGLVGDFIVPNSSSLFNGWLVFCGALAICALLLPGISGSYILTLLGVYPLIMEAMAELTSGLVHGSLNVHAFATLGSLGIGIVMGALLFARTLSYILNHFPNEALAVLSGFMIGALRSVWPFWTYEYAIMPLKLYKGPQLVLLQPYLPDWHSPLVWQSIMCAILGFLLVVGMEIFAKRRTA